MKILIFSPWPGLPGGVAEFNALLKRRLSGSSKADCFFTGQRLGKLGRVLWPLIPLYDGLRLIIVLMSQRHDVYHLNPSLVPKAVVRDGLYLCLLRLFCRKRALVFFHGWDRSYVNRIASSLVYRSAFRWAFGGASRTLVLATQFKEELCSLGFKPDSVHVVTTMFDEEIFTDTVRCRADSTVRILFLGRIVAPKGIYELLEAFQRISPDFPEVELLIGGSGPDSDSACKWCEAHGIQDRVRFLGHVIGRDKAQLLLDSDLFALPSYREGCPIALLEAMAAGLPVVVTLAGGIPDIIRPCHNGIVVRARDAADLELALRTLISDPELRSRMGAVNREEAWRMFGSRQVAGSMEAHYRAVRELDWLTARPCKP